MWKFLTALVLGTMLGLSNLASAGVPPTYSGERFPASAAIFTVIAPEYTFGPYQIGYLLDVDGDHVPDVSDMAILNPAAYDIETIYSVFPSPSDSSVVYVYYLADGQAGLNILVLRRSGSTWTQIGDPKPLPPALEASSATLHPVTRVHFFYADRGNFTQIADVRRLNDGSDCLLVRSTTTTTNSFVSRYALLVDGPDSDQLADTWSGVKSLPMVEALLLAPTGALIAREVQDVRDVRSTRGFWRLLPSRNQGGGIQTPTDIDSSSFLATPDLGRSLGGWQDLDDGLGYGVFGSPILISVQLTALYGPKQPNVLPYEIYNNGSRPYNAQQFRLFPTGSLAGFASNNDHFLGIANWTDDDADGVVTNKFTGLEVHRVADGVELGANGLVNVAVAGLQPLGQMTPGGEIRFADFGEFPGGETFAFRLGSSARDRVWISPKGFVSFVGPVVEPAGVEALTASHGIIAPAWSDDWDTSGVEILAGYAPVTQSFVTGERVLTFVIEWRGLRQAGWDRDRSFAMRLILYSDGSFRTDYGPIDEATTALVAGYAGPGSHQAMLNADLSTNSWGGFPAGTGGERVGIEGFSGENDLGHIAVRWRGYPERIDGPGIQPVVVNPVVRNGKLSLKASGSNIQSGARVIVDGDDAFTLVRNGAGKKWVVKANVQSVPSGRTISAILAAGGEHSIHIVNPDGEVSASVQVP